MRFLYNLYIGNSLGQENFGQNTSKEYNKLQGFKGELIDKLKNNMSEEQVKQLYEILDIENQITNLELYRMFEYSFRLAYSATVDILDIQKE